ncbi:hypothetical protein BG005_000746 [Podila minutissima]|nr:hypothetical protein BG005_000746 [Podila minutissima]
MPLSIPRFKGLGMGRKLSLTNLAKAVSSTSSEEKSDAQLTHDSKGFNIRPSLLLSPNTALPKNSDQKSSTSSGLATAATTPARSPLSFAYTQLEASPAPTPSFAPPLRTQPSLIPPNAQTQAPQTSTATAETTATLLGSPFVSSTSLSSLLRDLGGNCGDSIESSQPEAEKQGDIRPLSMCSVGTLATATSTSAPNGAGRKKSNRARSKATDILLNLESSSNDARFQEILHNTIALDHFRQFCFQEYSIENLLFWLDVELFSKPSKEFLDMDTPEAKSDEMLNPVHTDNPGQFAVRHARYIYLTYIDSNGPLQVNLSDETRTEIPWPILDYSPSGSPTSLTSNESELEGWPVDRRMFDAAQEHTYQLMKGHTLVRFEESDLWKEVEKIICEQPEEYAKAAVDGPLNSYYKPEIKVITDTVFRSRSRHPSAKLQSLYNWNNSTSDLDRSRDKEEALAKTMSQYFGPIPASIRHPARIILGLGGFGTSGQEDEDDDYYDEHSSLGTGPGSGLTSRAGKRISSGLRKAGFSRLNVGKKRLSTGSNISDDSTIGHHPHIDDDLEDSVENGKRITRWMVAGYFNDQVRLTAAQRKRLLRRNNKLTKFFGSRVDGTLRPVDEIVGEEGSVAGLSESGFRAGSNSAPSLGSPLAYALSSSNIHDMGKRSSMKSIKASKKMNKKMFSNSEIDLGSKSTSLLQKFKKSNSAPLEYDPTFYRSNRSGGPLSPTTSTHQLQYHPLESASGLLQSLPLSPRKQSKNTHVRAATVSIGPGRRFVAHPHPLWSGSLSDQEAGSGTYERRRGMSILSLMGGGANTIYSSPKGQDVLDPALPSPTLLPSGGNLLDRQAMLSRRKKADKLSTFFGATLTKQELASQLKMADEDDHLIEYGDGRTSNDSRHSGTRSKESSQEEVRPAGPSVATVNQLSNHERSILWKRNKKLRGLLGESLPESEVAHALTRPVLLLGSSRLTHPQPRYRSRRGSSARSLRSKRKGSTASIRSGSSRDRLHGHDDDSETFEDEDDELHRTTSSATKGQRASLHAYYPGRIHKRRSSVSRPSSLSSSASYSRRESIRASKSCEYSRPLSVASSDSIFTSQTDTWLLPVNEKSTQETNDTSGAVQQTRKSIASEVSADFPEDDCPGARFNRKKKMDKIQQFLGDRVPEQDLWMGAVGRERTLQMMNLNLISTNTVPGKSGRKSQSSNSPTLSNSSNPMSPTSISPTTSIGPGFSPLFGALGGGVMKPSSMKSRPQSLTATAQAIATSAHTGGDSSESPPTSTGSGFFNKHGFPGRSKSKSQGPSKESGNEAAPVAGVRLERSLSDPPTPFFGGLKISSRPVTQRASEELPTSHESRHHQNSMSTVSRLRLQLAASRESIGGQGNEGLILASDMKATYSNSASDLSGDDEGDLSSTAMILPRLRAMSEEDQERFLKRAEKLEKMFGAIPPSALLESSLTTPPLGSTSPSQSSSASSSPRNQEDQPRSLMELAGLLAHAEAAKSKEGCGGIKDKSEERSSEETVESLGILDA